MSPVVAWRRPTTHRPLAAIRLRAAPALEPPFDDELPSQSFGVSGAEQLSLRLSTTVPPPGSPGPADRPDPARRRPGEAPRPAQEHNAASPATEDQGGTAQDATRVREAGDRADPSTGPAPRRPGPATESWQAARRFMAICLEILNGYRPTGHIRPLTSPTHAMAVIEQLSLARERVTALSRKDARTERAASRTRRPGPPRGQPHRRETAVRLRVLRVCEPRAGIAEAAAVLNTGGRTWAMAVRLERRQGRWLCTAARTV